MRTLIISAAAMSFALTLALPARADDDLPNLPSPTSSTPASAQPATQSAPPPAAPPPYVAQPAPPEEPAVLLGPGVHHGGYAAPELKVTTFTDDAALLVGGQGGWIINRHVIIGGAGYGLATQHSPVPQLMQPNVHSRIAFGYGGPRIAFVYRPESVVHLTLGILVGAGGVTVSTRDPATDRYDTHDGSALFVTEPSLEMELNVHKHVRVALGGSYRFATGSDSPGLKTSDLSGPAGALAIKFGMF